MARTCRDVALLLSVQAGPHPASPISDPRPGERFRVPLDRDFRGAKVAWSPTLGGLPIDPRTLRALEPAVANLLDLGVEVEEAEPDLSGADFVFEVFRAHNMATAREDLLRTHRGQVKETIIWNIEEGLAVTSAQLREAERQCALLFQRVSSFFERYDFLVCPVSQVPPFPFTDEYVREIDGHAMSTYIEWMRSCSRISATAHPAMSLPGGFTEEGLPVGLQVVGRFRDELGLLQFGHAVEQVNPAGKRRPALVVAR